MGGWAKMLANAAQLLVSRVVGWAGTCCYRSSSLSHSLEEKSCTVLRNNSSRPAVSLSLSPGLLLIHCSTLPSPPAFFYTIFVYTIKQPSPPAFLYKIYFSIQTKTPHPFFSYTNCPPSFFIYYIFLYEQTLTTRFF